MAFDKARAALFVSLRGPVYVFNILSEDGWAQDRPAVIAGTLVAACVDAGVALRLHRREDRSLLAVRIPLDLVLVCLAALAVPPTWPYSGALIILVPVSIELIAARGLLYGIPFVAVADLAMYLTRRAVDARPYAYELVFYGLWILIVGAVAFTMTEFAGREHRQRFQSEQEAFRTMVVLETRNDCLLGRGGAVTEALNRTWLHLEMFVDPAARARRTAFREQQEHLSDETRHQAMYLFDAMSAMSQQQRSSRPAVAEHLHFTMEAREHRLLVLTSRQAAALEEQLHALNLTGRHEVKVVASNHITGELRLVIGGHKLHVPAARGRKVALISTAIVFGASSLLALTNSVYADLPSLPVLVSVLLSALFGLAAERKRKKDGVRGLHYLWLAALSPAVFALLMTALLPAHWKLQDGRVFIPAMVGLTSSLYIVSIIWLQLPRRLRLITVLFCTTWLVIAIQLSPVGSPPWRSVVGGLAIPASVSCAVVSFDTKNRDLGHRLHEGWVARLEGQAQEIRRRCASGVIDALQQQIEAAGQMLRPRATDPNLKPASELLAEAQFWLDELRRERMVQQVRSGS
ncbi:hypothetical protein [Streptomyces sp. NPDC001340]